MKDIYLMGRKPIIDAIKEGKQIEKVWLERSMRGEFEIEIRNLCKTYDIPLSKVEVQKINHLTKSKNHQGVAALCSLIEYESIENLIPHFFENGIAPKLLILDGIDDVHNYAAISRSAVWYGYDAIVVAMKNAAPVNSIGIKISAGALTKIPICRVKSLVNTVEFIKDSGFEVIASDMDGQDIRSYKLEAPFAIIMGSEERGVNNRLKSLCNSICTIPGSGRMESLNVSVAAAILMHESVRALKE